MSKGLPSGLFTGDGVSCEDVDALLCHTPTELALFYLELNSWGWPSAIPNPESLDEYNAISDCRDTRRNKLMNWIKSVVTPRFISRVHNNEMANDEFDDFWRGSYEGDKEALRRDLNRREAKYGLTFNDDGDITGEHAIPPRHIRFPEETRQQIGE